MSVDLPTPGTPVRPTLIALPVFGMSSRDEGARFAAVIGSRRFHERDRTRKRRAVALR